MSNLAKVVTDPHYTEHDEDVAAAVQSELLRYELARDAIEEVWLQSWAQYLGTPQSTTYLRSQVQAVVGDVNDDWRHRIRTGKAYEAVETIHSYLMAAFFPNQDWFTAVPVEPSSEDNLMLARIVKRYVGDKLHEAGFQSEFGTFLRQLLVTGTSVLALPWRYDTVRARKYVQSEAPLFDDLGTGDVEWDVSERELVINAPEFETLDMFDVYLDPSATDPNKSNIIRRLRKTKAELVQLVEDGVYSGITQEEISRMEPSRVMESTDKQLALTMAGYTTSELHTHELELVEFWGDLHMPGHTYYDVVITVLGNTVLRMEQNPYWCGKPFVVGTYVRTPRQPYAIGAIQPNLGMLHQLDIVTNQRLDTQELQINAMWSVVDDGVTQTDDIESAPGRVFQVGAHDSIRRIDMGRQEYTVTYQEAAVLEATIDKNFATGALIGANNFRTGERVTAAEIAAVREAGGNRLSGVHKHIERTSLLLLLCKVFSLMQQFVDTEELVRIAGSKAGEYEYYGVGREQLQHRMKLKPLGSDHVIERQKYIQDRLDFIQAVSQVPQMAQAIDYNRILQDLLMNWGFDEPEAYLVQQQQAPEQLSGMEEMNDALNKMGGQGMVNMVQAEMAADGGTDLMQSAGLIPAEAPEMQDMPIPPV